MPAASAAAPGCWAAGRWAFPVDHVVDVDAPRLVPEQVEGLGDAGTAVVRPAGGAEVARPGRHLGEVLEGTRPQGVEGRRCPGRVHARPVEQHPSRDVVEQPVVTEVGLEPSQHASGDGEQFRDDVPVAGVEEEVVDRAHPVQCPIGDERAVVAGEVGRRRHRQHAVGARFGGQLRGATGPWPSRGWRRGRPSGGRPSHRSTPAVRGSGSRHRRRAPTGRRCAGRCCRSRSAAGRCMRTRRPRGVGGAGSARPVPVRKVRVPVSGPPHGGVGRRSRRTSRTPRADPRRRRSGTPAC